ncbi:MAG TPA: hypothetical protein VGB42_06685 [Candidatus Thermoplasmatota archaeon]
MRDRQRILENLETLYREAFEDAGAREDREARRRLDFDFQRDQLYLEAILDVRDLLATAAPGEREAGVSSLLDKAQKLRNLTKLR